MLACEVPAPTLRRVRPARRVRLGTTDIDLLGREPRIRGLEIPARLGNSALATSALARRVHDIAQLLLPVDLFDLHGHVTPAAVFDAVATLGVECDLLKCE